MTRWVALGVGGALVVIDQLIKAWGGSDNDLLKVMVDYFDEFVERVSLQESAPHHRYIALHGGYFPTLAAPKKLLEPGTEL